MVFADAAAARKAVEDAVREHGGNESLCPLPGMSCVEMMRLTPSGLGFFPGGTSSSHASDLCCCCVSGEVFQDGNCMHRISSFWLNFSVMIRYVIALIDPESFLASLAVPPADRSLRRDHSSGHPRLPDPDGIRARFVK